jgi:hypothetical protein
VTNWTQYSNAFGGFIRNGYMPLSVYGFFANGGGNAWVVRVGGDVVTQPAAVALPGPCWNSRRLAALTSKLRGAEGNDVSTLRRKPCRRRRRAMPVARWADEPRFRMTVRGPAAPEVFENLTLRRGDARNV